MCPKSRCAIGGESDTDMKNSTSRNSHSLTSSFTTCTTCKDEEVVSKFSKGDNPQFILFPLTTPQDQMEVFYPRRLILGLWRVYGQFAVKMMRFQLAKSKSSLASYPNSSNTNRWNGSANSNYNTSSPSGDSCVGCNNYNSLKSVRMMNECVCKKNTRAISSMSTKPSILNQSTSNESMVVASSGPVNNNFRNVTSCQKSSIVPSDSSNFNCKLDQLPSPSTMSSEIKSRKSSSQSSCKYLKFSMGSWTFLVLFFLLLLLGETAGCGPGRGAGRRRAPRKLTPLVYKQHVPNVPENTLSASGLNEGRITRDHQKIKNLVPNYNQDIIFRDDEGSGADRLMTQRCKEKLNTLAISVMNQWPGVKLRVIEGWDEDNLHAPHSLHYEGRAVDITTSDKDRSKYGMLARLAVEAGFDWVYYESRAHIHCSVKSDSTKAGRTEGCFSGNSSVSTPTGLKKISEVEIGDEILTIDTDGKEVFSDVLLFLDRNTSETREFFVLKTGSGTAITLTPSHLIYTVQPESLSPDEVFLFNPNSYILHNQTGGMFMDKAVISFAKNVQIGDWILVKTHFNDSLGQDLTLTHEDGIYSIEKVLDMEVLVETGVYAPLTSTGNLIVDGVLASCYAVIDDQDLAHSAFLPLRFSHNIMKGFTYLWKQFTRLLSFRQSEAEVNVDTNTINKETVGTTAGDEEENEINYEVLSENPKFALHKSEYRTKSGVKSEQGVHWYAETLYTLSSYILPSNLRYDN